jgi:hypothetical protein
MYSTINLHDADTTKNLLRGEAKAQLAVLRRQMQLGKLTVGTRKVYYSTGVVISCSINFGKEDIIISLPSGVKQLGIVIRTHLIRGFACVPNSAVGLYDIGDANVSKRLVYNDGAWTVSKGTVKQYITDELGDTKIRYKESSLDCGNTDWKGPVLPEGNAESRVILTWRGPATRYFPLNSSKHYPNLTTIDTEYLLSTIYTPFTPNVYEGGKILAIGPKANFPYSDLELDNHAQILGAAKNANGHLFVIVKACYSSFAGWWTIEEAGQTPYGYYSSESEANGQLATAQKKYPLAVFSVVFKPRPGLGYWYEAYKTTGAPAGQFKTLDFPSGWELLAIAKADERPKVSWFFNESGTEAKTVESGRVWTFSGSAFSSVLAGDWKWESDGTYSEENVSDEVSIPLDGGFGTTIPGYHGKSFYAYDKFSEDYATYVAPWDGKHMLGHSKQGTLTITKSGTQIVAVDYKGDTPVYAEVTVTGTSITDYDYLDYRNIFGICAWVDDGEPSDHIPSGHIDYFWQNASWVSVNDSFVANVFQMCRPEVVYSISCGTINEDGLVTSLASCCSPCTTMPITAYAEVTSKEGTLNLSNTQTVVSVAGGTWSASTQEPPYSPEGYGLNVWLYPLNDGTYSVNNTDCASIRIKITSSGSAYGWMRTNYCGTNVGPAPTTGWHGTQYAKRTGWYCWTNCSGHTSTGAPYPRWGSSCSPPAQVCSSDSSFTYGNCSGCNGHQWYYRWMGGSSPYGCPDGIKPASGGYDGSLIVVEDGYARVYSPTDKAAQYNYYNCTIETFSC